MKLILRFPLAALLAAVFLLAAVSVTQAENPPAICNRVRFEPVPGTEKEMVGATVAVRMCRAPRVS